MNARSVSKCAVRRLGKSVIAMIFCISAALPSLNAAETTITVTGVVNGGRDMFHVFGMPKSEIPKDTPYTLIFTFDDAKGASINHGPCSSNGTGIVGAGANSPGIVVLTINGRSFEFGHKPDARSRTWRSVSSLCSNSEIGISVQEGQDPLQTAVNIKVTANLGKVLTGNKDWRGALSISDFDARNGDNAFVIRHPGNYGAETMSYLSVSKVTVARGTSIPKPVEVAKPVVTSEEKPSLPNHGLRPITGGPEISRIYVLSNDRDCKVSTFTPAGQKIAPEFHAGMGAACSGITLAADGRIYVSGMSSAKLKTFLPDGTPTPLALNGGGGSSGIALDSQGRLFVLLPGEYNADGVIRVFTPDMKQAMPPLVTHLNNVDGIAIDPTGKLYVASQGNDVIKAYDAGGKPLDLTIKKGINSPRAIALGPDGKIYAANYTNVTSYYPDGERTPQTITHINAQGGGPDLPMGIAVDPTGRLYIGYASGLLWVINPDGKPAGQAFMAQKLIQGLRFGDPSFK